MQKQPLQIDGLTDPQTLICRERQIVGMSAILLPFNERQGIDWLGFDEHLRRTLDAGLIPAINMDTGFAALINAGDRRKVLERAKVQLAGLPFVAGVFHKDQNGDALDVSSYASGIDQVQSFGGTPILFQSYGLSHCADEEVVANYQKLAAHCDKFLAFELGDMFAPFGRIYSNGVYSELMKIPQCVGAKHSSLDRQLEWARLRMRNEQRPDFQVLTGNDLAIDMVMYGSDYLLGLSTFAPDLFALRDRYWQEGDLRFYELNDRLQYLGCFAFREPVASYKHSAAMFLKIRGWLSSDATHPESAQRPPSDRAVLIEMGYKLGVAKRESREN